MLNSTNILLRHNYVDFPPADGTYGTSSNEELATVMMNLSYYGYALNVASYKSLAALSSEQLCKWWKGMELELKSITGEDRKIGDFVVYKNFPGEVLEKSEAQYWSAQLLIYWGFPTSYFTQEVEPREGMKEQPQCKVLRLCKEDTFEDILLNLLASPARWKESELQDVLFLSKTMPFDLSRLGFKENMIALATALMERGQTISLGSATDVLRLAVGLSDGDISLRTNTKFKSFSKPMRRYLVSLLESCNNVTEDFGRRPEVWKRLISSLHPGDFRKKNPRVVEAMDVLYKDNIVTLNAQIEKLLRDKNADVLDILAKRPGDFRRRLVHVLNLFGEKAADAFIQVAAKLTTHQIVSLRTFLETVNVRYTRIFPPKGNWAKLQIGEARNVDQKHLDLIINALSDLLVARLPKIKFLDDATKLIKLPNNGGDADGYTRGTIFPIPDGVDFIRTASYWKVGTARTAWFDNGWNFFDSSWKSLGACSWNTPYYPMKGYFSYWNAKPSKDTAAIFSGDPVSGGEMKGRAAQMIDLYPAKLRERGVRYAVWNILCFSRMTFAQVEDVFAALQWGKDANTGKLFEPSRCQVKFPLKSEDMTKFICLIDLERNELVFMDANFKASTSSASMNGPVLEKVMPAFMEYLESLPSVHDLFRGSVDKEGEAHIVYSDKDLELQDVNAYVFKPENEKNKYNPVVINNLLT